MRTCPPAWARAFATTVCLALLNLFQPAAAIHASGFPTAIDPDSLLETVRLDPKAAIPCFQLGLLAEKRRDWSEAIHWMEEFLKLDGTSDLAGKVRQELAYLRWVVSLEQTPRGADHRRGLDRLAQARAAFDKQEWLAAGSHAYEALFADPSNYEAHFVAAAAAEKIQRFDLAESLLQAALPYAPQERHPEINQAIAQCQRLGPLSQVKLAASKAFTAGKHSQAADGYFKAWEAEPDRYNLARSALQAAVIAEDYPKARKILLALQAPDLPAEKLPAELKDIPDLLARLDRLEAFPRSNKRSASSAKKRSGTSAGQKKKTMAEDFLSRIKK